MSYIFKSTLMLTVILLMMLFMIIKYHSMIMILINLLTLTLYLIFVLILTKKMTFLFSFIILIIYIGAMMIMFGYVCAISHNFNLSKNISVWQIISILMLFYSNSFTKMNYLNFNLNTDFLFNLSINMFWILIFMMLLLLLMMTSNNFISFGTFRELNL